MTAPVQVVVDASQLIAKLEAMPNNVFLGIKKDVVRAMIRLQREVKQAKLSGQVLKSRTGTLRRSIAYRVEGDATEIVGAVGTSVKYGAAHEFGFSGTVSVKAHLRLQKLAWGKSMKVPKEVTVRAHPMKMNLPERSFLRSAFKELKDELVNIVSEGSKREVEK